MQNALAVHVLKSYDDFSSHTSFRHDYLFMEMAVLYSIPVFNPLHELNMNDMKLLTMVP